MNIQMMLIFAVAILLAACGDGSSNNDGARVLPTTAAKSELAAQATDGDYLRIEKLEAEIQLPSGADNLNRYDRFYLVRGDEFKATYVRSSDSVGAVYIISSPHEIPVLMDGGCQFINLSGNFSAPANAILFCNGTA